MAFAPLLEAFRRLQTRCHLIRKYGLKILHTFWFPMFFPHVSRRRRRIKLRFYPLSQYTTYGISSAKNAVQGIVGFIFRAILTDISQKLRTFATALSRGSSAGYRSSDVITSPFFHRKYEYRVHFLREIPPLIFQFQYVFRNSRGHSPRSKSR